MKASLSLQRAGWMCSGCSSGFPVLGEIPWLFAEPQAMLAEWRGRLRFLLQELAREARIERAELAETALPVLTHQRLELLASAHEDHGRRLAELLAPLSLSSSQTSYETHLALRTRLPSDQGLTNYYVNVHRDWCWGDEENKASVDLIQATVGEAHTWGRTLVLGSGAGRLAYDLHMTERPSLTVAADFNPLLSFVAREVFAGRTVELYEFPIAPRTLGDHAILRRLAAPKPARPGLHLVLTDALRPAFEAEAFDTVVTPWLIDIIDEDFATFAPRVNQLLRPGGHWINFGSLAFAQGQRSRRYSLEETLELVGASGFGKPMLNEAALPYMRSPASRHSRIETVLCWSARKESTVAPPAEHSRLPEWLVHTHQPVPLLEDFQVQAMSTRIYAFLMALINGQRSVKDMARMLVEQRLMTAEDAEPAVRTFLTRMYEDSQRRAGF